MSETMTLAELESYAANIKASAAIMFATLNNINDLHQPAELESEGDQVITSCVHCSEIADAIVHFPCPTNQLLTEHMVVEPYEEEETPAE